MNEKVSSNWERMNEDIGLYIVLYDVPGAKYRAIYFCNYASITMKFHKGTFPTLQLKLKR